MTASPLDDEQLIGRCVGGDRASRETLARECLPLVRKLVHLGYGQHPDTEDVIQKALIVVFRDLSGLRDVKAFRSWMYRVSCHVIATHGARKSELMRFFTLDPYVDTMAMSTEETPEKATIQAQLFERVSHHLKKLKHKKRIAVTLSLFFGYVDTEIGDIIGCSSDTAKKRIQHGRQELIRAVQKDPWLRDLIKEDAI